VKLLRWWQLGTLLAVLVIVVVVVIHGPFVGGSETAAPTTSSRAADSVNSRLPSVEELKRDFPALQGFARQPEEGGNDRLQLPTCLSNTLPSGFNPFVRAEYTSDDHGFAVMIYRYATSFLPDVIQAMRSAPTSCAGTDNDDKIDSHLGDESVVYLKHPPDALGVSGGADILIISGEWALNIHTTTNGNQVTEGTFETVERALPDLLQKFDHQLGSGFVHNGTRLDMLQARDRVFVASADSGSSPQFEPDSFWASSDSSFSFSAMHWQQWTTTEASGTGIASVKDCSPDCASGSSGDYPVTLKLTAPRRGCGNIFFTSAEVTFPAAIPVDAKRTEKYNWGLPNC